MAYRPNYRPRLPPVAGDGEVPAPVFGFSSSYFAICCSCSLLRSSVSRLLSVLGSLSGTATYFPHSEERADIDDHCVDSAAPVKDEVLDAADVAVLHVVDRGADQLARPDLIR